MGVDVFMDNPLKDEGHIIINKNGSMAIVRDYLDREFINRHLKLQFAGRRDSDSYNYSDPKIFVDVNDLDKSMTIDMLVRYIQ